MKRVFSCLAINNRSKCCACKYICGKYWNEIKIVFVNCGINSKKIQ